MAANLTVYQLHGRMIVFSNKVVNSVSENPVIFTLAFFWPQSIKLFCDLNFFLKVSLSQPFKISVSLCLDLRCLRHEGKLQAT